MLYRSAFSSWSASDKESRPLSELQGFGFARRATSLVLDPATTARLPPAKLAEWSDEAPSIAGKILQYCEIVSPKIESDFPAFEAIPSWNTRTGEGSWTTIELSAKTGGVWGPWHDHGIWSANPSTIAARSAAEPELGTGPGVTAEPDAANADGQVSTDTLILSRPAEAFRMRIRLFSIEGSQPPSLEALSLAWSSSKPAVASGTSECGLKGSWIEGVPAWSQMIYPDGGNVWCSPTSLAMVLAYWIERAGGSLPDEEAFIRQTVAGVFDRAYQGHGNWSFNAAWAGERGFLASVRRFVALSELEAFIAAGQPLILSLSWDSEGGRPLSGAPLARSMGHLDTLLGFDAEGNPVMNEPASPDDASVRRVYRRAELEARWLEASGGAAYILKPGPGLGAGRARA